MYTYPIISDNMIDTENVIPTIQGPCGNCTYQSLSPINNYDSTSIIPRINDEQLMIEERYSTINGCFGTVRFNHSIKTVFYLKIR